MIERRRFLALGAGTMAGLLAGATRAAETAQPVMTDDGLYTQEWFLQSFLDLGEDLSEATANGKRFAVMWEQRGCPYCKETHLVNFADPAIQGFVRDNFEILQLNLFGAREVSDFDGEALEERKLARKYGIAFTPTIQFFPEQPEQIGGRAGKEIEVARMPGYLQPPHFLAMFKFVRERAYENTNFRSYLKAELG